MGSEFPYRVMVPMAPVAVIFACCATPSPKFRVEKAVSPSGIIHAAKIRHKVQAFQCHDARRHQVAGGEERVLQVGGHRLLACRYRRQVLHLDAQHDVEQEQYVEATK